MGSRCSPSLHHCCFLCKIQGESMRGREGQGYSFGPSDLILCLGALPKSKSSSECSPSSSEGALSSSLQRLSIHDWLVLTSKRSGLCPKDGYTHSSLLTEKGVDFSSTSFHPGFLASTSLYEFHRKLWFFFLFFFWFFLLLLLFFLVLISRWRSFTSFFILTGSKPPCDLSSGKIISMSCKKLETLHIYYIETSNRYPNLKSFSLTPPALNNESFPVLQSISWGTTH